MSLDRRLDRIEQAVGATEIPAHVQFWCATTTIRNGFAVDILGVKPWSRQAEILRAVEKHYCVSVRSGAKEKWVSSAAALALWWYCTRQNGRAPRRTDGAADSFDSVA